MDGTLKSERVSRQNISYYDNIAEQYDDILNGDENNKTIRQMVASRFTKIVHGNRIIDFGGGTGLDISWLGQREYQIIFCEPSKAMRQIAMDRQKKEFQEPNIIFLDDKEADFRNWSDKFPLNEKADAILGNFAVVNCIADLNFLFEKLALALKPGGVMLLLVLDYSLLSRLRSDLKGTIKSFFGGSTASFYIDFNGNRQIVYIHSIKSIRRASADKFRLFQTERLGKFGFSLMHLIRQ